MNGRAVVELDAAQEARSLTLLQSCMSRSRLAGARAPSNIRRQCPGRHEGLAYALWLRNRNAAMLM
jgi:hypothetical protein